MREDTHADTRLLIQMTMAIDGVFIHSFVPAVPRDCSFLLCPPAIISFEALPLCFKEESVAAAAAGVVYKSPV